MLWTKHKYSDYLLSMAGGFAIILAFFLPLSKSLTTVALVGAIFFLLISGDWQSKWRCIYRNPVTKVALVLYVLYGVSLFYTSADISIALKDYLKDRLLILLFLLPLFNALPKPFHRYSMYSFLAGCIALIGFSFLNVTGLMSFNTHHSSNVYPFLNHIFASFMLVFAVYLSAQMLWEKKGKSVILWTVLLLIAGTILFLSFSRTGYVLLLFMTAVFILQKLSLKKIILVFVLGFIASALVVFLSPRVQDGMSKAYQDVVYYETGHQFDTSVGSRLEMLRLSFLLWQEKPLLGHGIGSFRSESLRVGNLNAEERPELLSLLGSPHNEFAYVAVQLGSVGLLVLLIWIGVQFYCTRKLSLFYAQLAQGLILLFVFGCFSESMLSLSIPGKFFVFFLALLFSRLPNTKGGL